MKVFNLIEVLHKFIGGKKNEFAVRVAKYMS